MQLLTVIIGYGKIGVLKAKIYREEGCHVIIIDNDLQKIHEAKEDNFQTFDSIFSLKNYNPNISPNIFEIATPTYSHIEIVQEILNIFPESIINIEKPITNNQSHLKMFNHIQEVYTEAKFLVNENYLFSTTLKEILNIIKNHNLSLIEISAEFSKNRVPDIMKGRFIDSHLGAFGIEMPHLISILNELGITEFKNIKTEIYDLIIENNQTIKDNGGCRIQCRMEDTKIFLHQNLNGNINLSDKYFITPPLTNTDSTFRVVKILCDKEYTIYAQFEPLSGYDRLFSHIVLLRDNIVIEDKILKDDNLREGIKYVINCIQENTYPERLSAEKGIKIFNRLYNIKNARNEKVRKF